MEIWIVLLLVVAGASGWAGYFWASRRAPKREELDALAAELDEARRRADSVQANVNEHFEQSARLFGKLAGDYREFLEHFAGSAQALGLSESRTRELVQQSFQPLLTHEVDDLVVAAETETGTGTATGTGTETATGTEAEEVQMAAAAPAAEPAQPVRVAEVTLSGEVDETAATATGSGDDVPTIETRAEPEVKSDAAGSPAAGASGPSPTGPDERQRASS